jgi:predicted nucleic acid-binding protein
MPELPFWYWDSCVFLSYVNEDPARVSTIESLLGKSGVDFQIITSVASITEVAFGKMEQDGKALDDETEQKINALWEPPSPIRLAEFYQLIAEEAKALMRQALPFGWSLKPMDAIHLATCRRLGAAIFHTYDDKLFKYEPMMGFPVREPFDPDPGFDFGKPGGV